MQPKKEDNVRNTHDYRWEALAAVIGGILTGIIWNEAGWNAGLIISWAALTVAAVVVMPALLDVLFRQPARVPVRIWSDRRLPVRKTQDNHPWRNR